MEPRQTAGAPGAPPECNAGKEETDMSESYTFTVNGVSRTTHKEEPLLRYLRDELRLTSVKDGCSEGACGTCTIIGDGKAVRSCVLSTKRAVGKHILTVEGLQDPDGGLSPIQRAFVEEAAVQCGFCTPGIIMSAVEIVGSGRQYTRDELRKLISGHLCRCTGYQNILNAVERAVNEAHKFVGK